MEADLELPMECCPFVTSYLAKVLSLMTHLGKVVLQLLVVRILWQRNHQRALVQLENLSHLHFLY